MYTCMLLFSLVHRKSTIFCLKITFQHLRQWQHCCIDAVEHLEETLREAEHIYATFFLLQQNNYPTKIHSNYIAGSLLSNQPSGFQTIASQLCPFSSRLIRATPLTCVQSDWLSIKTPALHTLTARLFLRPPGVSLLFPVEISCFVPLIPPFFFLLCCTGFTASTVLLFTCWTFPLDLCCYV